MSKWLEALLNARTFKAWARQQWRDAPMRARQVLLVAAMLVVLAFCSGTAVGGTADLSWTRPAQYTDGTAIAAGTAVTYKVYGGVQGQAKTLLTTTSALAYTHTAPDGVTYCYHATATVAGQESGPSGEGCKVMPALVPSPPVLTVQGGTAFYVIQQENRFVLLPVGTVPNGTACDATQQVNGHSVVPRSAVMWFGTVRPLVVVASCV